jgi:hypothetical protein
VAFARLILLMFVHLSFEGALPMKQQKLSLNGLVCGLVFLLALGVSGTALAHEGTPYILPFQFQTDKDVATLYAGKFDHDFKPENPGGNEINGFYDITVTNPAGETRHIENVSRHKQLTLIEIDTREKGTYKMNRTQVSAKLPHVARQGVAVRVLGNDMPPEERKEVEAMKTEDGKRRFLFEDEIKPDEIVGVEFINHITAYVTREKPSTPKLSGKGFEFDFKVHPNEIGVPSGLKFIALVDGKPAPGVTFDVRQQGVDEPVQRVKSDPAGLVDLRFAQAGLYVLSAQAPLESVKDGKIVNPRYINWLVVEVKE